MSDSWLSQSVSSAFLEAFRRCDPLSETGETKHFMAFPAVVCAAFSAEVGLKTLLERSGISAKGHDLKALFTKLPKELQYAIYEATKMPMEDFAAQLAHSRLAFSEWRYIYEAEGEKFINLRFLGGFAYRGQVLHLSISVTLWVVRCMNARPDPKRMPNAPQTHHRQGAGTDFRVSEPYAITLAKESLAVSVDQTIE
jgi:hypothetical protein